MTFATNAGAERGSSVWTHHTNYTGAAGLHNECGRGTKARDATLQKSQDSRLDTIKQQHKKEMRVLQSSMLAYTEKMRKLSLEKFPAEISKMRRDSSEKAESLREFGVLSRVSENSAGSCRSRTRSPVRFPSPESLSDVIPPLGVISRFPSIDNVSDVTSVRSRMSMDSAFASSRSSNASGMPKVGGWLSPGRSSKASTWTPSPRRASSQGFSHPKKTKHKADKDRLSTSLDLWHLEDSVDGAGLCSARESVPDSGRCSRISSRASSTTGGAVLGEVMEVIAHPERLVPPIVIEESGTEWSDCSLSSRSSQTKKQQRRTKTKPTGSGKKRSKDGSNNNSNARRGSKTSLPPISTPRLPAINKKRKKGPKAPKPPQRHFRYSEAVATSLNKMAAGSSDGEWDTCEEADPSVLDFLPPEDLELAKASLKREEEEVLVDTSSYSAYERCTSVPPLGSPHSDSEAASSDAEGSVARKSVLRKKSSCSTIISGKKSVHFDLDSN